MTPPIAECRSSCRVSPRVTTVATTSFNNEIEEFFSSPASPSRPDLSGLNKIKRTEAKKETGRENDKEGRCNFVRTLSSRTMKASSFLSLSLSLFSFTSSCRLNDAASVFWNRFSRFCVEVAGHFVPLLRLVSAPSDTKIGEFCRKSKVFGFESQFLSTKIQLCAIFLYHKRFG